MRPIYKHLLESETTDAQIATEIECTPFFVDLKTLSQGQLDHLRSTGLLPPLPTNESIEGGSNIRGSDVHGKAAKLLGVENDGDGPKIELLNEDEDEDAPSPLYNEDNIRRKRKDGNIKESMSSPNTSSFDPYAIRLIRNAHITYLTNALTNPLPRGFVSLDASHPWMVYWCLHSLDLLGYFDDNGSNEKGGDYDPLRDVEIMQKADLLKRVVSTLEHCWEDVSLEFTAEDIYKDGRLKQLHLEQQKDNNSGDSSRSSITGGGFGGGPTQMPHCAPTYAAVLSLSIVASLGLGQSSNHPYHEAGKLAMHVLKKRRLQLYAFFLTLREHQEEEEESEDDEARIAFRMQHDGEIDVRASYCLLAPCYLLGLLDKPNNDEHDSDDNPLLSPAISRHIASCQTFEGGFGAEPFNEAHGGYTFCALAALRILGSVSIIDVDALSSWLARRQSELCSTVIVFEYDTLSYVAHFLLPPYNCAFHFKVGYEGGFCGRTNKLVDGCYSFWQGGAVAVFDSWCADNNESEDNKDTPQSESNRRELSFDEVMLQRYILLCAQDVNGGLRDKPSKSKDFYHSCYNLSGLSVAQHSLEPWPPVSTDGDKDSKFNRLFGDVDFNIIGKTDPVINIRTERVKFMVSQFNIKS